VKKGVCQVCNLYTEVYEPCNYSFALCRLCDRMPRGQVLSAHYLYFLRGFVEIIGNKILAMEKSLEALTTEGEEC
jgi:hypothetical protein